MIRHFILAFFLVALALPATAMPTPQVQMAAQDCHSAPAKKGDDHQSPDMRMHGCIGCIAPLAEPVRIMRAEPLAFIPFAEPVRRLSGTTPRPNLPPPRG